MSTNRSAPESGGSGSRRSQRIHHERAGKLPELAGCPRCKASYRNGRWTWKLAPIGSYEAICPACERIESGYPAGLLRVAGQFAVANRGELVQRLRNIEQRERNEHPLKRIIAIEDEDAGFSVTTTDGKLAETLGRALHKAYAGELERPPTTDEKENLVRVRWTRD